MLRKFAQWFICFGLSFLVQNWGWTAQGTAFIWLHLICKLSLIIISLLLCLFVGEGFGEKFGLSFALALGGALVVGVILFATWGATQLFNIDFAVAFQIMTFGQCLCSSESSKSKNN